MSENPLKSALNCQTSGLKIQHSPLSTLPIMEIPQWLSVKNSQTNVQQISKLNPQKRILKNVKENEEKIKIVKKFLIL